MPGIVNELQRDALDKSVKISDLLRKALLVARKLKIPDLESWILSELNGYSSDDVSLYPDYRWMTGEIKSYNQYNGLWLPIMFHESDAELHKSLTRMPCRQSVAEIESLIADSEGSGKYMMNYGTKTQAQLIKSADLISPPVLIVSGSKFHGIIDAVRTLILDWALKLEERGVIGENLSFSEEDRKAASHVTINIGSMTHSQIQSGTVNSQQFLSTSSIDPQVILDLVSKTRSCFSELELKGGIAEELKSELDTLEAQSNSPKPKKNIIQESLRSLRTILEGAAGRLAAEGLLRIIQSIQLE